MKKQSFISALLFFINFSAILFAQNTQFGTEALFSNTTGINNSAFGHQSLKFNTTGSNNAGFGHQSLFSNTTGSQNTGIGYQVLYSNTNGYNNSAVGFKSLFSNTTGIRNNAMGYFSLTSNSSGYDNNGFGFEALRSNTTGFNNVAIGSNALTYNTSGTTNIAIGAFAMLYNTTGSGNSALGNGALAQNTIGQFNAVVGGDALALNTTSSENVAIGNRALRSQSWNNSGFGYSPGNVAIGYEALFSNNPSGLINNGNWNVGIGRVALRANITGAANVGVGGAAGNTNITGHFNTYLGHDADVNAGNRSNGTALGYQATITASNQVRIGNGTVTSIGGQVGWTALSDERFKTNVVENVPGLKFINQLRPVTYRLDIDKFNQFIGLEKESEQVLPSQEAEAITRTGFLAQEVEKAAQKIGFDFDGVDQPKNERDPYGLRYAEFTVPLVKAVQELSAENEALKRQNIEISERLDALEKMIADRSGSSQEKSASFGASLQQNIPNPFRQNTSIAFVIPSDIVQATLLISNDAGSVVRNMSIAERGDIALSISGSELAPGVYYYALLLDGNQVDVKKMIVLR
jgi:hypothetical protein